MPCDPLYRAFTPIAMVACELKYLLRTAGRPAEFFRNRREKFMLHYALVFLVIALIAAVLGFGGIAGVAAGVAKVLFLVFLVLFVVSLIGGAVRR